MVQRQQLAYISPRTRKPSRSIVHLLNKLLLWPIFFSGLTAEMISCVIWVPVDVIKERLQVQSQLPPHVPRYRGNIDALMTISRTEGLCGIYKGYGATVASFGPFSAFYLMFYEQPKMLSLQ